MTRYILSPSSSPIPRKKETNTPIMPSVHELNTVSPDALASWMLLCCGSALFAVYMDELRPFQSKNHLLRCARDAWAALPNAEKDVAMCAHAPLCQRTISMRAPRTVEERWRKDERAALDDSHPDTLDSLEEMVADYSTKFGWNCVIDCDGMSAQQGVKTIKSRLRHSKRKEQKVAWRQQERITAGRLCKLLNWPTGGSGGLLLPGKSNAGSSCRKNNRASI